jgi:UDP-GlcNAc:undecaprenyl-phosphate GlcNAc-1-phosphate transferase
MLPAVDNNVYVVTSKDAIKLTIMMILSAVIFGLVGILMIVVMQFLTRQSYAQDAVNSHGVSQLGASRLGGVVVLCSVLVLMGVATSGGFFWMGQVPAHTQLVSFFMVLACALLGLVEDVKNGCLSPQFRLVTTFSVVGLAVIFQSQFIPTNFGVPWLDTVMMVPVLGGLLTVIFCVGFINAVNMADGANGLMPGVLTIAFTVFYLETGQLVLAMFMTCCGVFAIFNMISGRLFLGDAGSYGIGAIVLVKALHLFSLNLFSAPFLAVLFAYPCIDFLVTIVRRLVKGRPVFSPDNNHLHNRIHFQCLRLLPSKTLANTLTGVLIVSASSGVALAVYLGYFASLWPMSSALCVYIFLAQCAAYALTFYLTGRNRPVSQYVVAS